MTLNVIVPDREVDATIARLNGIGAQWRRWWGLGTHRHPAFANLQRGALTVTERLAPRVIGVPFHEDLTEDQVARVVSCFK
jgi:dTDP-4-amino-4,6-dideoxygalactose transaminase